MTRFVPIVLVLALALDTHAQSKSAPLPPDLAALTAAEKPLSPAQALAAMRTEPGLRVELAAAEPLTGDPVALAWDERGRLFVAENRGYPEGAKDGTPLGIIAMLEDTDGDGAYEKRTEFATGLTYPNGLMCWRGGIIVTCAPEIFYLKDTDGDGKADVRKVLLTGFEMGKTTQIRVAHPTLGMDGWIYLTSGLTGGKVTCPDHPERKAVEFTKNDTRFRPDTLEFEVVAGVAQFGQCFDSFGRKFTVDNRHPLQMIAIPPRYLRRNPNLAFSETVTDVAASDKLGFVYPLTRDQTTASMHPGLLHTPHAGTFTSSCGIRIYDGDALPPEFAGNGFTCEPAQSLVQRQVISPNGAMLKGAHPRPGTEVLVTADSWFRPVFAANAPDGALYVASMYRKFIDHPQYVPAEMRDRLDFVSGRNQGRIYRLTAASQKEKGKRQKFDLGKASTKQLVAELENPKVWWRETAFRLLLDRADKASLPILKTIAWSGNSAQARVLALRLMENLGGLDDATVFTALADKHSGVRENALQLAEPRLNKSADFAAKVKFLAKDNDARVRVQAALTLGELGDTEVVNLLARIAVRDAGDKWTRAASLSSVGKRAGDFLDAVLSQARFPLTPALSPGEREKAPAARDNSSAKSNVAARDSLSPLPRGEGQGEGKAGERTETGGLSQLLAETCRVVGAGQPPETLPPLLAKLASAKSLDYAAKSAAVTGLGEALRPRKLSLQKLAESNAEARDGLAQLTKSAVQLATDGRQTLPARQAAIGLLAFSDFATAGQPLQSLLNPQQPTEIQTAAMKALALLPGFDAPRFLLDAVRWKSLTPPVRETALASLLAQPAGVKALLAAIEAGAIAPTTIDTTRRNQLLKHRDKTVAAKAEELFKNLTGGDRMKVYQEYKSILALKGNSASGHAIFTKTCAQCHQLEGEGAKVGPDLTGIRNQPGEVLLLHILAPSYEIVAGFNAYEVETKDGRTATGVLASETPTSVTLRRALGEEETILRSNIATMTSGALSLMPDELEKTMSRQELRDLLGFLRGE
ncbi:MAG: c-type cytochrome [Verrucomicrobia bacterium]|nr:c-type cytochrome [Verrucomicrobiota bacterium]